MKVERGEVSEFVVVVTALLEVGRTGAPRPLDVLVAGQDEVAQARSVGQQPPPRVAGQD